MKKTQLTEICRAHLLTHQNKVGHGALTNLSKDLEVDVGTLRGIHLGKNTNATSYTIEKILKYFNDPLYKEISKSLPLTYENKAA